MYYTRIPVFNSVSETYALSEKITLIPSGQLWIEVGSGGRGRLDSMFFCTNGDKNEHICLLKEWSIFHSFIFQDKPIFLFHDGKLLEHISSETTPVVDTIGDNERGCDFENCANAINRSFKSDIKVSYRELYQKTLERDRIQTLLFYLTPVNPGISINYGREYLAFDQAYFSVVQDVVLLEIIFGHPPMCTGKVTCTCGKSANQHHAIPAKEWRMQRLTEMVKQDDLIADYGKYIEWGFGIRHRTVHAGKVPVAKYIDNDVQREEYNFERSSKEYEEDRTALSSLLIGISEVTRYLLLHHLYGLSLFSKIKSLKVYRSRLGATPQQVTPPPDSHE